MRTHLIPFLIAFLLLFLVEAVIHIQPMQHFLEITEINDIQTKLKQYDHLTRKKETVNVLAFGSSRTGFGFASPIFDSTFPDGAVNSYNFGIPSACDYYIFLPLLKKHIQMHGKPKLVLLEVSESLLREGYFCQTSIQQFHTVAKLDKQFTDQIFYSSWVPLEGKGMLWLSSISNLYRFKQILEPERLARLLVKGKKKSPLLYGGWQPQGPRSEAHIRERTNIRLKPLINSFTKMSTTQLEYLVEYCQNNEIPVVLVQWPDHPFYGSLVRKSRFSRLLSQQITEVQKKYGLPLITPDREFEQHKNLFYEGNHLNKEGAEAYTRFLATQLESISPHTAVVTARPSDKP